MSVFEIGDHVVSVRDRNLHGIVVGYGVLRWPQPLTGYFTAETQCHAVLLVQVTQGSATETPACVVLRADRVERASLFG